MKNITTAFLLFLAVQLSAKSYYCDPVGGSMNNNGSFSSPWSSFHDVSHANLNFLGGDTIYLMNGNHGNCSVNGVNSSNVVITRVTGHIPVITRMHFGFMSSTINWKLFNVDVKSQNSNLYSGFLIETGDLAENITIEKCKVSSNDVTQGWTRTTWRTKVNHGIRLRGKNHVVRYTSFSVVAIAASLEAVNTLFQRNFIRYFTTDGIRISANGCKILDNSITDNITVHKYTENHADGIQLYSNGIDGIGSDTVSDVEILRNRVVNMTTLDRPFKGVMQGIGGFDGMFQRIMIMNNLICSDTWHGITLSGALWCRIVNNTIVDPYVTSYYDSQEDFLDTTVKVGPGTINLTPHKMDNTINAGAPSSANIIVNNIMAGVVNQQNGGTVILNSMINGTSYGQYFTDANNFDFQLKVGSPAIDAGSTWFAPGQDIDGVFRPQFAKADHGCFEHVCAVTPPKPTVYEQDDSLYTLTNSPYYNWYHNGQFIPNWNKPWYIPTQAGQYEVSIEDNQGCKTLSLPFSYLPGGVVIVGNEEVFSEVTYKVYPNPGKSNFTIEGIEKLKEVQLFSMDGRSVNLESLGNNRWDASIAPKGSYIIRIRLQDGKTVHLRWQKI